MVLMRVRPSAPASTQASAMVTMSVTSGASLAKTGTPGRTWSRTARTTDAAAAGCQANTRPRSSTLGQAMLTSMPAMPGTLRSRRPRSAYSSTLPPATETIVRTSRSRSQGRSRSKNVSMPGPGRPMAVRRPLGVSVTRGVGRPARACGITDAVTKAPRRVRSKNWASSRPAGRHTERAYPERLAVPARDAVAARHGRVGADVADASQADAAVNRQLARQAHAEAARTRMLQELLERPLAGEAQVDGDLRDRPE